MTSDWHRYVGAELYHSLGTAISQWQNVEIGVYHVFHRLTHIPSYLISSAVFFSPINFKDKLAMTHSAALFALVGTQYLDKWVTLHRAAKRKNDRRNQIAHFMSIHSTASDDLQSWLRPNLFDAKAALYWHEKGKMPHYTPSQLRAIATSFGRLSQKLDNFASEIADLPPPSPDKSPLSEDHPPSGQRNIMPQSPTKSHAPRESSPG
ncbi:MAG TPA: hypothetical protein VGA50_17700 [Kiloniellales bacterium]